MEHALRKEHQRKPPKQLITPHHQSVHRNGTQSLQSNFSAQFKFMAKRLELRLSHRVSNIKEDGRDTQTRDMESNLHKYISR